MSEIKSLADQLRKRMEKPGETVAVIVKKSTEPVEIPGVLDLIRALDTAGCKTLIHARFDEPTVKLIHHLKMATGIEVSRLLLYAIRQLLEKHPEIREVVKAHLDAISF